MFPALPIESNCRSIHHACRRQPNHRRTRQVSTIFCVIATEASNLLPLFYRSLSHPHYPRFVLPIRGCCTLACWSHFTPYRASLRIGLRCFHSPRCRTPARISGKDFPLPFCTDSNQPSLMCFFFYPLPFAITTFSFSPLYTPPDLTATIIVYSSIFFFRTVFFRLPLGLRHLRALQNRSFTGILQKTERNGKVSTLLH